MKKIISIILLAALSLTVFTGCAKSENTETSGSDKKIVVGASPTPHAVILKEAAKLLKEKGYELEVKEFSDYIIPNTSLEGKEIDANYFQHLTYLNDFNEKNKTHLVSAGSIHYEPFGIYAGKTKSLSDLKDGASISVPNDTTNEARALLLLQEQGLIKLKEGSGVLATKKDIVENKKNIDIKEMEAAQLVRSLEDVDFAVINGNYAILGGLKVLDALKVETADSKAAEAYANVIAIRKGEENSEKIKALVSVLKSDEIKSFIDKNFSGAVVPTK